MRELARNTEFITVSEAAKMLGCGVMQIRAGLINGTFPIGIAWFTGTRERDGQWHFKIPREPFEQFLATGKVPINE